MSAETILDRLAAHRLLVGAPREQLAWLAERGVLVRLETGGIVSEKDGPVRGLHIVLSGHLSISLDRGEGPQKVMEWRGGDITGVLPYSRLTKSPGDVKAEIPTEIFTIPREEIPKLARECYEVTAILVHVMVDRAKVFRSSDLHAEKMSSLGKLAAGLAHELNNPASAVIRSAKALKERLEDVERTSVALGTLRLVEKQREVLDGARVLCLAAGPAFGRSPLERADREDAIAAWLERHELGELPADAVADSALSVEALDRLAAELPEEPLRIALAWLVAKCAAHQLATEIETAASRIHTLVGAVKGFTYMDQATMPKPVDVGRGLEDTLAILSSKARAKSLSVELDVEKDLPRVDGFGGELNQVWANLVDNALDAAKSRIDVAAARRGASVVVTVTDDGAGLPEAIRERIFDPFFTTKPVGQGTGLGLDIARRIVAKHHGAIEVESEPGRTRFRVTLPGETGKA